MSPTAQPAAPPTRCHCDAAAPDTAPACARNLRGALLPPMCCHALMLPLLLRNACRKHIVAFGGDHTRVMIHGCSAGGVSIANHLTQPLSWPFFTSAAMESGNQLTFTDAVPMADAQASFDGLLRGLGCSSLDCLVALNTSQLINAPSHLHASPVVDGVNLVDFPRRLLRAGQIKRVPTIVGSARDEVAGASPGTQTQHTTLVVLHELLS